MTVQTITINEHGEIALSPGRWTVGQLRQIGTWCLQSADQIGFVVPEPPKPGELSIVETA